MPKKNYRQTKRETTQSPAAVVPSVTRNAPQVFNPDYSPVIRDLKRIGILAGSFIAILIVLSFFL